METEKRTRNFTVKSVTIVRLKANTGRNIWALQSTNWKHLETIYVGTIGQKKAKIGRRIHVDNVENFIRRDLDYGSTGADALDRIRCWRRR